MGRLDFRMQGSWAQFLCKGDLTRGMPQKDGCGNVGGTGGPSEATNMG